jgi:hypothetical protein
LCALASGVEASSEQRCPEMERFEHKSQWINASSTQRDASQNRCRRSTARLNHLNQASISYARRRVAQMEGAIANFERTILELEGWIAAERSRPHIHHPSTLANSLTQRRDTLQHSIEDLKRKLAETQSLDAATIGIAIPQ